MRKENNPYIVSEDVNRLMRKWAAENKLSVPNDAYFFGMLRELERTLSTYFDSVEVVPEKCLTSGLSSLASKSRLPVVSLDRTYVDEDCKNLVGFLDVTRAVDENLENIGLTARPGSPPISEQVAWIVQAAGTNRVALLDDVLFEGGTHTTVAGWLEKNGVCVEEVLVGIAIEEGVSKLAEKNIRVRSVLPPYRSVVDEVCQRDFAAGVPMSGRTVVTSSGQVYGAPYFSPFGKPEKWASIPDEQAESFSGFCLAQSIMLWAAVEKLSGTKISTEQLPKRMFRLQPDKSVVNSLKRLQGKG